MPGNAAYRDHQIDLVKALAIWMVLIIHTSFFSDPVSSAPFVSNLFWRVLAGSAVPLFLMCSGALMLRTEKELTLHKLFFRSLLRFVIAMLLWAMVYKVQHLYQDGQLTPSGLVYAFKEVLLFRQEFHFYYLHIMMLIYVLLPVLRLIVREGNETILRYLLGLLFVFGILAPTVKPYWPFTLVEGIPTQWIMNMTYAAIGYCLLGWYLRTHPLSRTVSAVLFAVGFVFTLALTYWFSAKQGSLDGRFLEGMTLGPCLMAAGLYGLLLRAKADGRAKRLVTELSRGSFCVYLVHVFFLNLDQQALWRTLPIPRLLLIPLAATALLFVSMAVYEALSRIPVVNRWLI